jgi:hypothetical protein
MMLPGEQCYSPLKLLPFYESGYLHWMIDPSQLRLKTPLKDASLYLWGTE